MTTIAWDGTWLAADRGAWSGGIRYPVRKVFKIVGQDKKPLLVAFSGDGAFATATLEWLQGTGPHPGVYRDDKNQSPTSVALIVDSRRRVRRLNSELKYTLVQCGRIHSSGAGQDVALGALAAGASARKAVRIAMKFTDYAAFGVDAVRFD